MLPTELYIEAVLYDAPNDTIFTAKIPIQKLELGFHNKIANMNDLESIKFSGKIKNTYEGSILLGCF